MKKQTKEEREKQIERQVYEDHNGLHHPTGATYLGEGMYINRYGNIVEGNELW